MVARFRRYGADMKTLAQGGAQVNFTTEVARAVFVALLAAVAGTVIAQQD